MSATVQKVEVVRQFSAIRLSVAIGVFWFVWGHYGFWWGILYGLFWPVWLGYRLAHFIL